MLRWPQLVRWIQWEGELDLFTDESPYIKAENIEKMADDSEDFDEWLNLLKKFEISESTWLEDENLYSFLKKRLKENERSIKALEVGVW